MVAKCGRYVIWHWAHMPGSNCDPWYGPESEWHRDWKGRFPAVWREIVHIDERTGERHIADVKTPHGLVIEFQHSPIGDDELASRESFYQNMIWIVDGDGGTLNASTFNMGLSREPLSLHPLVHLVEWWSSSRLLHRWDEATAPVYIDFREKGLWRYCKWWPGRRIGAFSPLESDWLLQACNTGEPIPYAYVPQEEEEYLSQPRLIEIYCHSSD